MARIKKLTDYAYSPTKPASEDAIRQQIDDSIQEVYDAAAKPADTVNLVGNQTVAGVKTFSSSPIVPTPTTDMQAGTKKYTDDHINSGTAHDSIYINKTNIAAFTPSADYHPATKKYIDDIAAAFVLMAFTSIIKKYSILCG